jgi:DNA-binding HxlR family transcriptional regulator
MQTGHDTPSPGGRLGALFERARRGRAAGREERGEAAARAAAGDRESPLDWRDVMTRLDPVRRRWDLAILANLRQDAGRRPADLLAAINGQAGPGQQLSPQVLSGRLRRLEETGYVRYAEISRIPRRRSYWLLRRGRLLIEDLGALGCREDGQETWPRAGAAGAAPP